MTTPASGAIATSDVNNETGRGTTTQTGIDWIRDNTKGSPTDYNSLHGLNYYQRNQDGNCNNGNCDAPQSSGNIQCQNCTLSTINCANCDGQNYLQSGSNCNCTYNCNQNADQSYNCNCACACNCFVCACACW
jgi:hypothetical protein